ncbi:MAG: helix-turn-helix transcriptional regulator [Candidatus Thiodiazotropha sp. (ex Codakia rugifera)]|nr:helix-turn-helix transcriptional regulator [Candidatus Thiodiazotropha sp. (ex Codakia rugifera)]
MSKNVTDCPIRQVIVGIAGKWIVLILLELSDGALRFGVLKRKLGSISQRVLTEKLRGLERDGYLTRSVDPGPPVAVSYELTAQGHQLVGILEPLMSWAANNHANIERSRAAYDGL